MLFFDLFPFSILKLDLPEKRTEESAKLDEIARFLSHAESRWKRGKEFALEFRGRALLVDAWSKD